MALVAELDELIAKLSRELDALKRARDVAMRNLREREPQGPAAAEDWKKALDAIMDDRQPHRLKELAKRLKDSGHAVSYQVVAGHLKRAAERGDIENKVRGTYVKK